MTLTPDQEAWLRMGEQLCDWQTRAIEAERELEDLRRQRNGALTEYAKVAALHFQTLAERDEARAALLVMYEACEGCVNDLKGEADACFKRCLPWIRENQP